MPCLCMSVWRYYDYNKTYNNNRATSDYMSQIAEKQMQSVRESEVLNSIDIDGRSLLYNKIIERNGMYLSLNSGTH